MKYVLFMPAFAAFLVAACSPMSGVADLKEQRDRHEHIAGQLEPCMLNDAQCLGGYLVTPDHKIFRLVAKGAVQRYDEVEVFTLISDRFAHPQVRLAIYDDLILKSDPRWKDINDRYTLQEERQMR
jgi:hypothetical protein